MLIAAAPMNELVVDQTSDPMGDGSGIVQVQHCVIVKLSTIHIGAEVPLPTDCGASVFVAAADAVPPGQWPGVLTPPPRDA